ncbi:MAG: leucyl-tRNA synthetase [Candidatus Saccharibacteria bacterium]|nr:leucyl-tRNA synthetase [Candidatus Saccharibacteria bacterium]
MKRYNPTELEPKWQKVWSESGIYKTDMGRVDEKHYVIPMLPYPSGDLHVGHWYNFGPTDAVARFRRMTGKNVLTTLGFDAFGLPAENAAIARGIQPAVWTRGNIKSMKEQLAQLGASYDWDHSLMTCDPEYYRWNQWLFLKLYEKGLAYRKKALVNWCPKDQTVLANEQVVGINNVCERCGTPVIQKELEQWFFKITDYADRLLDDLEKVDWPEKVKVMQENWIGRSRGALIDFSLEQKEKLTVFTTRPDTIYGATYMVIAPEHPLVDKLTTEEQKADVAQYAASAERKTELERKEGEKDKTGVFTGSYAINPATKKPIPIWIADYVLMSYGTGAIMAVPAHDERDFDFATAKSLPILQVIEGGGLPYSGEGKMMNSGKYDGSPSSEAREQIEADLAGDGVAEEKTNYRLRDWLISRQRYWGTPIPIVYCEECGMQPVLEDQLPVILPEDVEFELTGQSPLIHRPDFVNTKCPQCGGDARRETDTMDTFMDSSWYFLRYIDNKNDKEIFDTELVNRWAPVDHYIGGVEHAILHLLYARFMTKFLHDHHGLSFDEPFRKLTNQGIILGPDGQKMSKSRGNVINPDEQVKSYGADSLRLYMMFMGPYEQGGPYNMGGIAGTRRFLDRIWTLMQEYLETPAEPRADLDEAAITAAVHRTIKKVTKDIEKLSFNTAIAAMMSLVNELYKFKDEKKISRTPAWRFALETLAQLLAPMAPHITEEIWADLGHETSVHISRWPQWDDALITEEMTTLGVQVNGKLRGEIVAASDISEQEAVKMAKEDENVAKYLEGKTVKKEIYVPGRLVSLVIQ